MDLSGVSDVELLQELLRRAERREWARQAESRNYPDQPGFVPYPSAALPQELSFPFHSIPKSSGIVEGPY